MSFDPSRALDADPKDALVAWRAASRQLLLPVDVDRYLHELLALDLEPAALIDRMREFMDARARGDASAHG